MGGMESKGVLAGAGQYLMIGRHDDNDQEVYTVIDDLSPNADLRQMCSRVLFEIGRSDPVSYDFSTLLLVLSDGGVKVVLTRTMLARYVFVNYG